MASSATLLASLETAIASFIAAGMPESYTHEGVTVSRASLASQMEVRDKLRSEVSQANAAAGGGTRTTYLRRGCR